MKKKITACLAAAACGLGLCLGLGALSLEVSATTVSDVIACAYEVGLPETYIQRGINRFGGGTYTSEQCDKAIAALRNWRKKVDASIQETVEEGASSAVEESSSAEESSTAEESDSAKESASGTISESTFANMTLEEKVAYINSLPEDERTAFINNMSTQERNSFLKQLDTDKQLDIVSSLADVGDSFGLSFSVDEVGDGSLTLSARDTDGNLVDVTTFGDSVEETGIPYTKPILAGGGAVLLALGGFAGVYCYSARKTKR